MQQILITNCTSISPKNIVDLFVSQQAENKVKSYLKDKIDSVGLLVDELLAENTPAYIIEKRCMDELIKELRPSRFNYIISILVEEFETGYNQFEESGILTYEVINLIEVCKPVFEALGFTGSK